MSTVRAPQVAPRRAPARRRPDLQVVRPPAKRFRSRAVAVAFAIVVVFVALLASAVFHALLAQGQQRLDKINSDVATQQQQFEQLRYEVAQRSAPQAIVAAATTLGMVQPAQRTLITPAAGAAAPTTTPPGVPEAAPPGPSPSTLYTELKHYLGTGQ